MIAVKYLYTLWIFFHASERMQSFAIQSGGVRSCSARVNVLEGISCLFLDCDGTIAETEKDMTLLQFNEAFKRKGFSHQWNPALYGDLLNLGVSQKRLKVFFDKVGYPLGVVDVDAFCQEMKELKDEMFDYVWETESIPLRPGVLTLVDEALNRNIRIVVCSNSNYYPVHKICTSLFGVERMKYIKVIGGNSDGLKNKKPSPDIYNMALRLASDHSPNGNNYDPSECLVVEDSAVGLQAALAAHMKCIVTPSYYTANEDFTGAYMVIPSLETLFSTDF